MRTIAGLLVAAFIVSGCSLPWNAGHEDRELNVVFVWKNNQIALPTATLGGHTGTFLLASAHPRTAVDPLFAQRARIGSRRISLTLGQRRRVRLRPAPVPLQGLGDATIGADAFQHGSITIDYARHLLVLRNVPELSAMPVYSYDGVPNVPVILNGNPERAVIDTLLPDTIVIPRRLAAQREGRVHADLSVGGVAFPRIDAAVADVEEIRLGNRLLANFLVTIDYSRNVVALWRDPRAGAPRIELQR